MARQVDLIINTIMKGEGGLTRLRSEINQLNKALMDEANIRRTVDATIEQRILANQLESKTLLNLLSTDREYLKTMVDSEIRKDALNIVHEKAIELLRRERMETVLLEMAKNGEIKTTDIAMIQKKMKAQLDAEDIRLTQIRRREILATTMSIFGMTMSIWQMTNALSAMAGDNEMAREEFKRLQAMMMGATGPILLVLGIMQLLNMEIKTMGQALIRSAVPGMMALSMAVMALTTQSKELKVLYSVITGIMVFLAVLSYETARAKLAEAKSTGVATGAMIAQKSILTGGTSLGPDALAIAGAIGITATLITAMASLAAAQTSAGQYRRIENTGIILAHKGETIGRVSEPIESGNKNESEPQLIILQIDGEELGRVWANIAEREDYVR
jgi:hypothetical protein